MALEKRVWEFEDMGHTYRLEFNGQSFHITEDGKPVAARDIRDTATRGLLCEAKRHIRKIEAGEKSTLHWHYHTLSRVPTGQEDIQE